MTSEQLFLFDMPDPSDLPSWLEQLLASSDLHEFVLGLAAVKAPGATNATLIDVCGPMLESILESGLQVLSPEEIRALVQNPWTLLELQELVLVNGGVYWDTVAQSLEDKSKFDSSLQQTLSTLEKSTEELQVVKPRFEQRMERHAKPERYRYAWVAVAVAASLLIAFAFWSSREGQSGGGWGFDEAGLLAADVSGREYLLRLSDAAGAFSNKIPDSRASTLRRMKEFKAGCEKLIAAPHTQLVNREDREWLVKKCNDWLIKIEVHIAELEQGKKDWREVLAEAVETSKRMQAVLKAESDSVV